MSVLKRLIGSGHNPVEKILGAPARATDELLNGIDHLVGKAATSNAGKKTGKALVKGTFKKDPHGANFSNAFTGFQEGPGMIAAAAVGSTAWAAGGVWKNTHLQDHSGEVSYTGTAPIHNYDGVSSAPTLGAQGSMVFGMNKARRG